MPADRLVNQKKIEQYEKLSAFYMGRQVDVESGETMPEPLLYKSKDLTTHAVIIGMTGSGKTGLGLGLIEEAAIDKIPVIAIDPKGDLGNIMLNFPKMQGEDLEPWVDPQAAANKDMSRAEYAARQAETWRKGLADWDQPLSRIQRLREAADTAIYTPGSNAGLPLSVLQSFTAPGEELRNDYDTYSQHVQATATSLLTLMGIDADPLTSREHILISNILQHYWNDGQNLDVAALIGAIQNPPIDKIGVMPLDSVYPPKDRMGLAMRLNGLLAAPGFAAWMKGEPLSARSLLYTESGKPRVSVLSIAHLSDAERMFIVTLVLSELISWMRSQPGTGSLRAILYMDEIFGYMPPLGNPASKVLLLTLLKQARAFGVGLVLATQNPVDLDYKGLSNTGTWFIGRLQTERDKARVLEGLKGASGDGTDAATLSKVLTNLGQRQFLLHNVHDRSGPSLFSTRWVLSYLAGPLTREQIKTLTAQYSAQQPEQTGDVGTSSPQPAKTLAAAVANVPPAVPPEVRQFYLPATMGADDADASLHYRPAILGTAEVLYSNRTHKVEHTRDYLLALDYEDGQISLDWADANAIAIELNDLASRPEDEASYAEPAPDLLKARKYSQWERLLKRWIRVEQPLQLHRCQAFKLTSAPGESEGDFRIRLQDLANEKRTAQANKLQKRYETKFRRLDDRIRRAEQKVETQEAQKRQKQLDTAVSVGATIFGALFGSSRSSVGRAGSAVRSANRIRKESQDVEAALENLQALQQQLRELEADCQAELDELVDQFDAQLEELTEVLVRTTGPKIHVPAVGLLWCPYWRNANGRLQAAWE